jgi:hypothetical protein
MRYVCGASLGIGELIITFSFFSKAFTLKFVREEGEDEKTDTFNGEVNEDDDEDDYDSDRTRDYPSDWGDDFTTGLGRFIGLGSVPTTNTGTSDAGGTGRILSFPNWIQVRTLFGCSFIGADVRSSIKSGGSLSRRIYPLARSRNERLWVVSLGYVVYHHLITLLHTAAALFFHCRRRR